jgi:CPA2 family monovalent cation:H+ antiporter-2/glutathione-regulated potassium-efflux system ancillary protein KefC
MTEFLSSAFIYLAAAVIAVPIAKRIGLGSVLGYLIAGVLIGPLLGLVGRETQDLQHFAEFGIVMMLFLVGLELEPRTLWAMRGKLLGMGGLQVGLTTALVWGCGLLLGFDWRIALILGMITSISSTTIVLQTFTEMGVSHTPGGRSAFSVLLFQDIIVIPMLAIIPLLALPGLSASGNAAEAGSATHSMIAALDGWAYAGVIIGSIAFVILGGHFLSRPLFRFIANTGLREAFTAAALTLVVGIASLMLLVGLSPALGAFLAGVVLATSEFRHELETDIEPFKGILVGLFFITVGAGVQFEVLAEQPGYILALTLGAMTIKALVLLLLAKLFRLERLDGWLLLLSLPQMSAFGFVLLAYAAQNNALPADMVPLLSLVIALSMFLTPVCFIFYSKVLVPFIQGDNKQVEEDEIDTSAPVIIAGIGRFGQIVDRLLRANQVNTVVLDQEPGQIDLMRKVGIRSYYGDATRIDLLRTAGIEGASLLVVAIDEEDQAVALVAEARKNYPRLPILARARSRPHFYRLCRAGADHAIIETYHSALALGTEALKTLGAHPFKAEQQRQAFDAAEKESRSRLYRMWSRGTEGDRFSQDYRALFIELEEALSDIMQRDRADGHDRSERGWTPPPKRP